MKKQWNVLWSFLTTLHLSSSDQEIALQAARGISSIVKEWTNDTKWKASNDELFYLSMDPSAVQSFLNFEESVAVHLLGAASMNRNGYVREAALKGLAQLNHPDMLGYLLVRQSDWVKINRTMANQVLVEKISIFPVSQFVQYHFLIDSLDRVKRVNLTEVKRAILSRLSQRENRDELLSLAERGPIHERLFCWRALGPLLTQDPHLLTKAFEDSAFEVRTWAISQIKVLPDWKATIKKLLSDRSIRVRYSALKVLEKHDAGDLIGMLNALLFDQSKPIREQTRFLLKPFVKSDFHSIYETRLIESPEPVQIGVLAGYVETAQQDISNELLGFLTHRNFRVRILVLYALERFSHPDTEKFAVEALSDRSNKVKAAAVDILSRSATVLSLGRLREILHAPDLSSKRCALRILASRSGLESAKDILAAIVDQEVLRDEGWKYLRQWYQQNAIQPKFHYDQKLSKELDSLVESALSFAGPSEKSLLSMIQFLIRTL